MPQEKSLTRWEYDWSPRLRGVSLAAEFDVDAHEAREAAAALGAFYRQAYGPEFGLFAYRWPATVVTAMTAVAVDGYESGGYWPAFDKAFEVADDQRTHAFWGETFKIALKRMGLETFDGLSQRLIGPVLMHAGVPLFCFDDLLKILVDRLRLDPDLDADTFLTWANDQPQRIRKLDVPVRRFLGHGNDFALDFVDRCLEMLETLSLADGDVTMVALPSRFTDRALDLVQDGSLAKQPRRTRTRNAHAQLPM